MSKFVGQCNEVQIGGEIKMFIYFQTFTKFVSCCPLLFITNDIFFNILRSANGKNSSKHHVLNIAASEHVFVWCK